MEAQAPDTKPVEKKEKEEEKKGGMFADFFGSGSTTLGAGAGGFSGAGGLAGLLSTKAGLIAAIAIGATVAGVLGLVGYKTYGPSRSDRIGGTVSLFAPKPAADPNASAGVAGANGNSDSLQQLVSANQQPADAAPKDGAAANADRAKANAGSAANAADAAKAAEAAKAAQAAAAAAASKSAKPSGLQSKFGGLGGSSSGGSSGHSFSANAPAGIKLASTSGLSRGAAGGAGRGGGVGRRFGGAASQALGALRDQRGAITSQGSGATYDGSKPAGIGADGARADGGAQGSSARDTAPSGGGNNNGAERFPAPPPGAHAANVTPWQNAINTAEMLLAGAALLIFLASKGKDAPGGLVVANVAAGVAMLLAMMAAYIGQQIASGPFGQVFQGNMFVAAGTFMSASAIAMMIAGNATGSSADVLKYVAYGSGALGLGMGIMAAMQPKYSYPPDDFKYMQGGAPDFDFARGSHGDCKTAPRGVPGCS